MSRAFGARFRAARQLVPWSLVVFGVALAVRLYQLGGESVWIDEAISFARASKPYPQLLADSIHRKHLPTYFLLLKCALQFGDSEAAMRLPSALLGSLSALMVYFSGRVVAGRLAGFCAGMLVALARQQVHHGQEARMYTLFTYAVSVALFGMCWLAVHPELAASGLVRVFQAPRERGVARRTLGAFLCVVLGTTLALYTHNTAVFFLVALNLAALALLFGMPARFGFARNWIVAMLCVLALWSFWLPTLFGQSATMESTWKGRAATPSWVALVLAELFLLSAVPSAVSALLLACGAHALFALRRRMPLLLALCALAFVGPACAFVVSQKVPMFYHRTLLWAPLAWFVLVGIGIAALPRVFALSVAGALVLAAVPQLRGYYAAETKPGWRPLLAELVAESDEHSLILCARAERFLRYYFDQKSAPLPRREFVSVRRGNFERAVGDASEFFVVGQTTERAFQRLHAAIAASGRYRARSSKRDQNAIVIKYRRLKGKAALEAAEPPDTGQPSDTADTSDTSKATGNDGDSE